MNLNTTQILSLSVDHTWLGSLFSASPDKTQVSATSTVFTWDLGSRSKESACNAGDVENESSIPGSRRSPEGGTGNPL